jgi:hypothetical protein
MQFFMKRPTLLFWLTVLAIFAARVSKHHGGHGFHQW